MQTKPRFDPNSPQIKAYLNEIAHQFVREGMMIAFPLCLPGMTTPIAHDESRITALDIVPAGHIYGGTSGRRAHLFVAAFHGLTGIVFDAGTIPDSTSTAAVCCGESRVLALVNGSRGGRAVAMTKVDLAQDWIQEWGLEPPLITDLGECVPGEPVIHAISSPSRNAVVGITARHVFTIDVESGRIAVVGEAQGRGHIALGRTGIFGQDDGARLWRFDASSGRIRRAAVDLPEGGDWSAPLRWARDRHTGVLFTSDAAGRLFAFDEAKGFRSLGKAHLAPVGPMALTPDGRLFGFCGTEIANLFCCDTTSGTVTNLGVAASVLEQRRYGYQFAAAVTGPDGELVFGEDDNGGHLWLYFAKITSTAGERAAMTGV